MDKMGRREEEELRFEDIHHCKDLQVIAKVYKNEDGGLDWGVFKLIRFPDEVSLFFDDVRDMQGFIDKMQSELDDPIVKV